MISKYFEEWEVKSEFEKEFISIFNGWLDKENMHKLDEVKENEWSKFNDLVHEIYNKYKIIIVDLNKNNYKTAKNKGEITETYTSSINKDASQFSKFIIPELECVLTEEWDYTYILWHKNNGAKEAIAPLITKVGLFNFNE